MRTRHGNGATERQCEHRLRKSLQKRIRMNGNVKLETRHYTACGQRSQRSFKLTNIWI